MGENLAGGWNEYPWFMIADQKVIIERHNGGFATRLKAEDLDQKYRDVTNWPAAMREEYGDDEGIKSAIRFRDRVVSSMR